ncbi:MAG: DUF4347 domain-containing protein [Burkholderiales bacterium]
MSQSIVFVDARVTDIESLSAAMPGGAEIQISNGAIDGLDQIAAVLQRRSGFDAIHIVSHGNGGGCRRAPNRWEETGFSNWRPGRSKRAQSMTVLMVGCYRRVAWKRAHRRLLRDRRDHCHFGVRRREISRCF